MKVTLAFECQSLFLRRRKAHVTCGHGEHRCTLSVENKKLEKQSRGDQFKGQANSQVRFEMRELMRFPQHRVQQVVQFKEEAMRQVVETEVAANLILVEQRGAVIGWVNHKFILCEAKTEQLGPSRCLHLMSVHVCCRSAESWKSLTRNSRSYEMKNWKS